MCRRLERRLKKEAALRGRSVLIPHCKRRQELGLHQQRSLTVHLLDSCFVLASTLTLRALNFSQY